MIRYKPYSEFLKSHFGTKVYKVALDAGFTCPNKDGTVAKGGCTYCAAGSRASYVKPGYSLRKQMLDGMVKYQEEYGATKFLAYFQAFTNTHGPVDRVRKMLSEPLDIPEVVGLSVGTRPDCVSEEILNVLEELSRDRYLLLEMGLESFDDSILKWINRGHDAAAFLDAVRRAKARGLRVCTHVILGFPGETNESVIRTGRILSDIGIEGIKIHNLHVIRHTALAKIYREGSLPMISRDQYVERVRLLLENLDPSIWIHRVTGEAPEEEMLAPDWARDKRDLLNAIQRELSRNESFQGKNQRLTPKH